MRSVRPNGGPGWNSIVGRSMPWHPQRRGRHGCDSLPRAADRRPSSRDHAQEIGGIAGRQSAQRAIATDSRLEDRAQSIHCHQNGQSAKAELAAMIAERDAYRSNWRVQVAEGAIGRIPKAERCPGIAEQGAVAAPIDRLHADRDATVLTVAKVSTLRAASRRNS